MEADCLEAATSSSRHQLQSQNRALNPQAPYKHPRLPFADIPSH